MRGVVVSVLVSAVLLTTTTIVLASSIPLSSSNVHPLTAKDLVQFHSLSAPTPAPSGQHALFTSTSYNATTATTRTTLHLLHLESETTTPLTTHVTTSPVWVSDTIVAGLAADPDGIVAVWWADVRDVLRGNNTTTKRGDVEFTQLTHFPIDIANLKCHPTSRQCAFSAQVYSDGSLDTARARNDADDARFDSGVVYDELFVRHWDTYTTPGRKHNLFLMTLHIANNGTIRMDGDARNVMPRTGLESPVPPFGGVESFDFSPDGHTLAFSARPVSGSAAAWSTHLAIYTVPTAVSASSSESPPTRISHTRGANTRPTFDPRGTSLAYLSQSTPQYESDKNDIVVVDLRTRNHHRIASRWKYSPESLTWAADAATLYLTAQEKGHVGIYAIPITAAAISNNRNKHIPKRIVKKHTNTGLTVVGTTLFFAQNSVMQPSEVYTLDLTSLDSPPRQRTRFNADLLVRTLRSEMEEFWFPHGQHRIHGQIYKPAHFSAAQTYPLAFLIHGGPEGAWTDGWSRRWNPQVFTGAGYVVVTVNFRGSTGYGEKFKRQILGQWGGRPYKDLMKGLHHVLATYPYISRTRICALGASYGGYMINWLNSHTTAFSCFVNHDGMFSPSASYYATDELYFPEVEFGGPPYAAAKHNPQPQNRNKRAARYEQWDPSRRVHKWTTPTLVIHGEKDFRLPVTEGIATFTALQRRGVPSRLLLFPDENHWVLNPPNSLMWHREVLRWLDQWIGPAAAPRVRHEEAEQEAGENGKEVDARANEDVDEEVVADDDDVADDDVADDDADDDDQDLPAPPPNKELEGAMETLGVPGRLVVQHAEAEWVDAAN
ncbi:hypothetical protein PhCBS80983_g05252 [Powellomyces hirtus]|uniref:Dipeptidyl-peptidase V n=1 Tax=Powellomyces hirtus TaxID=109895 RepID=A0A507DVD7_9FUNG|nr:hypothetical protein PhCBS80983_g05252 [Powellomyces hirtus]